MATKKKGASTGKSAKVSLTGGAGQGGRTSDLKGGGGPEIAGKDKTPAKKK